MTHLISIEIRGGDTQSRKEDLENLTRILPFPDEVQRSFTMERIYWSWFDNLEYFQRNWQDTAAWLLTECPKYAAPKNRTSEEEMRWAFRYLVCGLYGRTSFHATNDRP